jgi:hypothetical protein
MNFFLSKYYLLEKATLPELISAQTIEALAQRDIPGIFMAMKPSDATLTDEQVHAIKEFRTVFAEKYDYTNDWMVQWQHDFAKNHGSLKDILSGLAWATLVPTGVAVMAHGELLVWRVRAGEPPKVFKNYDAVEPTQTGDTWLITWEKEIAKPDDQIPAQVVALDYAEKLYEDKTDKERFDILSIDSQFDTDKQNAIPAQNPNLGRRVLAIAKRLEAAGHPFAAFKPLLNAVSQHATVGKDATAMLAKYSIKAPRPVPPEKPAVKPVPEKPVVPVIVPEKPVIEPEAEVETTENATENTASFDYTPILWGLAVSVAIIFAYQYYDANKSRRISPGWAKPTLKIDSLVKKNPEVPKIDGTSLDAPKPAVRPDTPVALPKPKPKPKSNFQQDYETAKALLKTAESNIESCPDCIDAALQSLEKANLGGLDAASVFATSGRVRDVKEKVSAKLKNEAATLMEEGEKVGNDGKSVEASRILTRAKSKLELEVKLKPSEDGKARLKRVKERIAHWDSVFGAGSNG